MRKFQLSTAEDPEGLTAQTKFRMGCKTAKENLMNKKIMACCVAILLVAAAGSLSASAMTEDDAGSALWGKANTIADASESYLPGVRQISYQETDGKGNTVYADQAVALLEGVLSGRYIQVREFGDEAIFDLMDRYTDGLVLTPFVDNLYAVDYSYTGVSESVNGKSTDVYTFKMALDSSLLQYDPNYTASGTLLGWDSDDDDFDGTCTGTIWLDRVTGAPVKLVNSYSLPDNTTIGSLKVEQTIYFTLANGIVTPNQISTVGKLTIAAGTKGQILVTDFTMNETQSAFWQNENFIRG